MIDRAVAVALVALSLVVVLAPRAGAQTPDPSPSEPDCGQLTPICDAIEEVEDEIGPVGVGGSRSSSATSGGNRTRRPALAAS